MSYFYCYYFNCKINRQSHAFSYNFGIIVHVTFKFALGYASYNYTTVTITIIPKLYSIACDYLYKLSESEGVSPSTRIVCSIISWATRCFKYYISCRYFLFNFIDLFLSIIIICAVCSISTITSTQLFCEEGIIYRLGEGFYKHKILRPQVILYSI